MSRSVTNTQSLKTNLLINEIGFVLSLLRLQIQHLTLTIRVLHNIPQNVQILPDYEHLNGARLKGLQSVIDTEAVLTGVLGDLVKVLADQLLLLDELDILQAVRGELNGLVEAILTAIRNIDHLEN
jgi:hypothetical protein